MHFERGVSLYGERNYRGALVEFKRAYALAPNVAVLYNVGETEYQLEDYAEALSTFDRYLTDSGPSDGHRAEVETNVAVLRSRVGRLTVTTVPQGADVAIDDRPIGRTPLANAVRVSIGRRKVAASFAGRPSVVRYIDVAAEDDVSVTVQLSASEEPNPPAAPPVPPASAPPDVAPPSSGAALRAFGWVTAAAFAGGAVAMGVLAVNEADALKTERGTFPTTTATLTHDANLATTYAVFADSLAAAAVIVGGVTLFSTLSSAAPSSPSGTGDVSARITVSVASARFEMTF
jgi:PEGA domain